MHDESQLLGYVRYPCTKEMLYIQRCNEISHKIEKEGKPHGKNPSPKREISTIKKMREKKTSKEEKIPPRRKKREFKGLPFLQHPVPPRDLTNECT